MRIHVESSLQMEISLWAFLIILFIDPNSLLI